MSLIMEFPDILEESRRLYSTVEGKPLDISEEINMKREDFSNRGDLTEPINVLCHGDNCGFMKTLIEKENYGGKINMIYIDPPFFSKADYDAVLTLNKDKVKHLAYKDSWETGIADYLKMLGVRFMLMKDLLSEDGTIWVHLDWHVVHYVKVLLDEIFGEKNFVNEIIWNYKSGGTSKKHFARKHDTILVYSKSGKYYFAPQKEKSYNRGFKPYRFKGVKEYRDDIGWYTMVNMKDVWQLDMVGRTSAERTGYATQKPEALLQRIIMSATKEGDICADFFCGSGTLAATSEKMGRKWICCDFGRLAVESTLKRLDSMGSSFRVYEMEPILESKKTGSIDISLSVEEVTMSSMKHITIEIGNYKPGKLKDMVDEKTMAVVKNIVKLNSMELIEYWSVDYNFDGKVHRPEAIFIKSKETVKTSCEKLVNDYNIISVKIVDVFGNCIYKQIKCDIE
ncbi:MAG: site-specific DNA-methyltransferase [Anaerovoracaceae bacterium]